MFYYWFAFPALNFPSELNLRSEPKVMREDCSGEFCSAFSDGYAKWREERPQQSAFFGVQGRMFKYRVGLKRLGQVS